MKTVLIALLVSIASAAHAQSFFKVPPAPAPAPVVAIPTAPAPAPAAAAPASTLAPAQPAQKSLEELAEESMLHQHVIDESRKWPWPEPLAVREARRYPAAPVVPTVSALPPVAALAAPAAAAPAAPAAQKTVAAAPAPAPKPKTAPTPTPTAPADPIAELIQGGKNIAQKAVPAVTPAPTPAKSVKSAATPPPSQICGGKNLISEWNCMRKLCVLPGDQSGHPECVAWQKQSER